MKKMLTKEHWQALDEYETNLTQRGPNPKLHMTNWPRGSFDPGFCLQVTHLDTALWELYWMDQQCAVRRVTALVNNSVFTKHGHRAQNDGG